MNKRADALEKEVAAAVKKQQAESDAEIQARFARMREERVKTMGQDGWKYYTKEDAFYLQKKLRHHQSQGINYSKVHLIGIHQKTLITLIWCIRARVRIFRAEWKDRG